MDKMQIRVIHEGNIADFNKELDRLTDAGWDLDRGSLDIQPNGSLLGVMRKYPVYIGGEAKPVEHEAIEQIPTPFDAAIAEMKARVNDPDDASRQEQHADALVHLLHKRNGWRNLMADNPDVGLSINIGDEDKPVVVSMYSEDPEEQERRYNTHKELTEKAMHRALGALNEDIQSEHPLPSSVSMTADDKIHWVRVTVNVSPLYELQEGDESEHDD